MGRIHVLDDAVINKIAAGEVVERPASVVKEMVENALDAGATAITVSLKQGGTASIVVTDNGSGMDREDAYMALKRHATSKISAADDLFCIQTMGFRGEALASIAAVSRFSLATVAAGSDLGIKLETLGGEDVREIPWSGPQGTTLAVEELFYNVPARAKFLKAPATELSFCLELMQAFALCHPEVAFTLIHNGKEQLRVPAVSGLAHNSASTGRKGEKALRERATAVLGKDAEGLLYVSADSRYGSLEGLISPPGLEKATGKHLFAFVNGRWVKDKIIRYGLLRGYHSHILKGRFPVATLHLSMDPSLVDVNAHPAKTELRFQYPAEVQNLLALTIRDKIRAGEWAKAPGEKGGVQGQYFVPGRTPSRGEDDPGLGILVTAELPPEGVSEGLGESLTDGEGASQPSGSTGARSSGIGVGPSSYDRRTAPAARSGVGGGMSTYGKSRERSAVTSVSTSSRSYGGAVTQPGDGLPRGLFASGRESGTFGLGSSPTLASSGAQSVSPPPITDRASLEALLTAVPSPVSGEPHPQTIWRDGTSSEPSWVPPIAPEMGDRASVPTLGAGTIPWEELQHVGTFARCFLLFECQDKLLVVDQHAFHERILFEKLSRDQSLLSQSQKLLVPEALDMAPSDVAQLVGQKPALVARGFDFEDEGPGTLVVKAVPSILAGRDLVGLFGDLAKGLQGEPGGDEPGDTNAELARLVLATAACHGAVRAGEDLSPQDLKHLLVSARDVDFVQNCPHGRRVFRWWTRGQVAGWFDR